MCEPRLSLSRVEFRTPIASHADLYRSLLGDIPGVSVVDGPLLEGCVADAVIAPTNSFGYLDAGIDSAFARRFGRRLQRSLQERIGCEFDAEMPIGQAAVIPSGDLALPFVVAAPATQFLVEALTDLAGKLGGPLQSRARSVERRIAFGLLVHFVAKLRRFLQSSTRTSLQS
jgi:hypothetical protein